MCSLDYKVRSEHPVNDDRSSTYVGMITVGRTEQEEKALLDMVTREVGRDRLVRAKLTRRESYKRSREEKRSQQSGLL